ncbi:tetratricopeptide repeat protein [Desulfopila inferna]|uniref:tetratricopeptide repeat protein n=1 Tax=Desulfopila inferna TaxID=468528 RepID=UPI001963447B|nr:tetratricopeptide repeat protein [Desulfopila inferna]MBM9603819.1 tetratricopeptide repeat protein [Desulfopila inferna]
MQKVAGNLNCVDKLITALLQTALFLGAILVLSSCSYLQQSGSADLDRQIERQQAQQEMIAEPSSRRDMEEMTVSESEEMGDRYLRRGDINKAYFHYIKGLAKEPDNVSLLHKQGALLLKKKRYGEAEAIYSKLLNLDGKDPRAFEGLGRVDFGLGNFKEAESNFLEALKIDPELYLSHQYMGLIYSRKQNFDQAIYHFQKALADKPGDVGISNNLAVTYYLNGNFKKAVALFRETARISNDRKIYNNLALAYFQLGLYEEALESFRRGSEDESAAYNNMGYEFLSTRQYTKAIKAFEKAIELHPRFYSSAQKNLSIARQELAKIGGDS